MLILFTDINLLVSRALPCLPPTWLPSPFPPVASLWAGGKKRQKRKARREKRKEKGARGRGKSTRMNGRRERGQPVPVLFSLFLPSRDDVRTVQAKKGRE